MRPKSRTKEGSSLNQNKDSFNRDIPENVLINEDSEVDLSKKVAKIGEYKYKKSDDMITTLMKQRLHRQRASAEK